ncbi:MAG: Ni/Fe-hydrogenase, b-type cytochrome subunit [Cellvibrionaceae bacterium]|nr:Ni/Fe-hydrogenase, b-type cytochrome subunit [Cellvibrionaceae bacterium]MCV6625751.1 Ni/Fe-hydrogenase, b-type cytochrome subunit [Cellvibrionaceae bacterium]
MSSEQIQQRTEPAVYVYEVPVRLWHWVNALAIVVLCISGYFIGSPLPSVPGEAIDNYLMGYIRFAHFAAAYIFVIGFIGRLYWAIIGNRQAREIFLPPLHRLGYWGGVWHEIKWYLFLAKEPRKYTGHNPLAVLAMHFIFVWGAIFMMITGLALYGEGSGYDSWQYQWFSSWVIPLFGQSQDVHTFHHLGMWLIIVFVMIHIYVAIREDIMSRQSLVSSMISGWRTFRDHRKVDDGR